MNDAAVLADPETGLVIDANEPAERLWKRSRADLIGSHQTSLHPEIRSEAARLAFENHIIELQRDNRASIQIPIVTSAGDEIPTEISSSLIHIGGRTPILVVSPPVSGTRSTTRSPTSSATWPMSNKSYATIGTSMKTFGMRSRRRSRAPTVCARSSPT